MRYNFNNPFIKCRSEQRKCDGVLIFYGINHYNPSGKQVAQGSANNIMKLSFFRLHEGGWRKSKLNHAARELCYYVIKQARAGPRANFCEEGSKPVASKQFLLLSYDII